MLCIRSCGRMTKGGLKYITPPTRLLQPCRSIHSQRWLRSCSFRSLSPPIRASHLHLPQRYASNSASGSVLPNDDLTEGERKVFEKLSSELQPTKLEVQDISGGCGSMYGVDIVSPKFSGLTVIKQHKLVNSILADDIKEWHGMQLKTRAP